jgi:hypothetical protein
MVTTEKTYEMMWDCEYCGQKKLLGKTHRHCPHCGGPQNSDKRYFPPDNEKVAVEDHPYVGADLHCPACQTASSRAAKCCGNCGSPLTGGRDARMQQEQVFAPGTVPGVAPGAAGAAAPAKNSGVGWIVAVVGLVVVALVGFLVLRACWTRDAGLEVKGHSWTREIAIERYDEVRESAPCKSMPSNATGVTRSKAEPKCTTRKVDKGDGTYKEKRECTEPEEQCSYTVTKWKEARSEKAAGNSVSDTLRWPDVTLRREGTCVGCERQGDRREIYTVRFLDSQTKKEAGCDYKEQGKWSSFKVGSKWSGKVRVVDDSIDCDSLKAAK